MTNTPDLKPCPFCGGSPEWMKGSRGNGNDWHYLACGECESMGPYLSDADTSPFDCSYNKRRTIELWNTRAHEARHKAELAAVLDEIERLREGHAEIIRQFGATKDGHIAVNIARVALKGQDQ